VSSDALAPAEPRERATTPYPLVDGKISAARLELGVAEHCNLACRSCNHLSPVMPKRFLDAATLRRDLELLSRSYHVESVRLLGGEPLLHRGIVELIAVIRGSGIGDSIAVVSNGVLLPRMGADFWRSVDFVHVSLYPGNELSPEAQHECRERAQAHGTVIKFYSPHWFRESYAELGTRSSAVARAIYDSCLVVHKWRCHTLADGRLFKCPQSYYLPKVLDGCRGNDVGDSLVVEDSEHFRDDLFAFLTESEPLQTCGHCLGTVGAVFPHRQVPRAAYRAAKERRAEDLIDLETLWTARTPRVAAEAAPPRDGR
jgi:hypothetical protein